MAAAINLQELEQELTRTKAMFEQWSAVVLSQAQGCKSSHTSKLLASKGWMLALINVQQHPLQLHCCNNTTVAVQLSCRGDGSLDRALSEG